MPLYRLTPAMRAGLRFRTSLAKVRVKIDTVDAPVQYAGTQGEFMGLDWI